MEPPELEQQLQLRTVLTDEQLLEFLVSSAHSIKDTKAADTVSYLHAKSRTNDITRSCLHRQTDRALLEKRELGRHCLELVVVSTKGVTVAESQCRQ